MALGANFATVNHLLINALVLEAFQEVFPGVQGQLVYFISHNIARKEIVGQQAGVGAPQGRDPRVPGRPPRASQGTPFADTGHPILLPGNPQAGSAVMVADPGARLSVLQRQPRRRPRAGPQGGDARARPGGDRPLVRRERHPHQLPHLPADEAPAAYKDFDEVLDSVEKAGLASEVARLKARFVIKDASAADD